MLDSLLGLATETTTAIPLLTAVATIIVSLLTGALISFTYMKTSGKNGHSQNFALTLVLTPAVVAAIILLIGSNIARAFSLAGAFSIIRYRSAPGNPKDIAYVLFTMAAGLGCGVGLYGYAILFTVVLCVVMAVLYLTRFGARKTTQKLLKITVPEDLNHEGAFDEVLKKNTVSFQLKKIKTTDFGSLYELVYSVTMDNRTSRKEFLDELRCRNGNLNISLSMDDETNE